jgi:hypothetical protein
MKTLIPALAGRRRNVSVVVAALLTVGAVGGWAASTTIATMAGVVQDSSAFETQRKNDLKNLPLEETKAGLIGSYVVTGTDAAGESYIGAVVLDIAWAPSGALELTWDNGKNVGVGEVVGDMLAVASLTKGRTVILMMNINSDGSLSGKSLRRTDRGSKGTETWKKT